MNTEENLAEYAHEAWSGWIKYMFGKCQENGDGTLIIPKWAVDRWNRQAQMDYMDLPEDEKESDREEARAMMKIINKESS